MSGHNHSVEDLAWFINELAKIEPHLDRIRKENGATNGSRTK